MKLKKLLSTVVASVLAASAVTSAMAQGFPAYSVSPSIDTNIDANGNFTNTNIWWKDAFSAVPIPADDEEAFKNAEEFYNAGLYYQAKLELGYIDIQDPDNFYNGYKRVELERKVDYMIARWEVSEGLKRVDALVNAGDYWTAWNVLIDEVMTLDYNMDEWYDILYYHDVIVNAVPDFRIMVRDGAQAIARVKAAVAAEGWNPITSDHEWYTYAEVSPTRIDVYVVTDAYGTPRDVAGFRVDRITGDVYNAFYSKNPDGSYDGGSYDVFK